MEGDSPTHTRRQAGCSPGRLQKTAGKRIRQSSQWQIIGRGRLRGSHTREAQRSAKLVCRQKISPEAAAKNQRSVAEQLVRHSTARLPGVLRRIERASRLPVHAGKEKPA